MKQHNTKKGFSVLFASLVGSLVLAIGLAILSITIKQITLSSAGRESQKAFYAADTGTEFALFLDRGGDNRDDCPDGIFPVPGVGTPEICDMTGFSYIFDGVILNDVDNLAMQVLPSTDPNEITTMIRVERTDITIIPTPICFEVYVTKKSADSGVTVSTEIESRGYSTCNTAASNRFERAIRTFY